MRFTQTSRLIAVAVLLVVATAIAWWGVGYHLGAALVNDASAWHYFSYGASGLVRLFALAIIVLVTLAVAASSSPQMRWIAIGAVAIGAVLLYGDQDRADVVGVVLFVLSVVAVSEAGGTQQITTALVTAIVVSFVSLSDLPLPVAQKTFAILIRAIFFYTPLLLGPAYLERYVMKRIAA